MKVDIYSKPYCPFCIQAKNAFLKNNIEFKEYIVGQDASKEDIQKRVSELGSSAQVRTVPQIFIDNEYIGGYSELKQKYDWA